MKHFTCFCTLKEKKKVLIKNSVKKQSNYVFSQTGKGHGVWDQNNKPNLQRIVEVTFNSQCLPLAALWAQAFVY